MSLREATEAALAGGEVDATLLEAAFGEVMDGKAEPVQLAGLLVALRAKGETVSEIVAIARALRSRGTTSLAPDPQTIDCCGTGGSGIDTFNISTTAAFVTAGAGVSVAKHGNRAATSRSGSFDVLEALGVDIDLPIDACADILREIGIGTFFARTAHPAYRHVGPVREALGIRTVMNCIGPLLNPVGAGFQVVGVYSADLVEKLARALVQLGARRALVVHGSDGLDEITITGKTFACLVEGDSCQSREIDPLSLGFELAPAEAIRGGTPKENAETTRKVLAGETGPRRDVVLLNAGAAIWVADAAPDHAAGIEAARESIATGGAAAKLDALIEASRKAAAK